LSRFGVFLKVGLFFVLVAHVPYLLVIGLFFSCMCMGPILFFDLQLCPLCSVPPKTIFDFRLLHRAIRISLHLLRFIGGPVSTLSHPFFFPTSRPVFSFSARHERRLPPRRPFVHSDISLPLIFFLPPQVLRPLVFLLAIPPLRGGWQRSVDSLRPTSLSQFFLQAV